MLRSNSQSEPQCLRQTNPPASFSRRTKTTRQPGSRQSYRSRPNRDAVWRKPLSPTQRTPPGLIQSPVTSHDPRSPDHCRCSCRRLALPRRRRAAAMMIGPSRTLAVAVGRTPRRWVFVGLVIALGACALQTRARTQADGLHARRVYPRHVFELKPSHRHPRADNASGA